MVRPLFAVLDTKARVYASPFTSLNISTALRDFQRATLDPNSNVFHYPEDYILFEIGTFNDDLGTIEAVTPPINHGSAVQFKKEV